MTWPFHPASILVLGLFLPLSGSYADSAVTNPVWKPTSKLYLIKCAKCHKLYPPENYSATEWEDWMSKMKRKSKLKEDDYQRMLEFTHQLRVVGSEKNGARKLKGAQSPVKK